MNKYDLIIIGGGAGAFAAAIKANELKAKTLMVNDGLPLGGTCVNVGCVPSKTLLWAGEVMHLAKNHAVPGIEIEVKSFDFKKVIEDELNLVHQMRTDKYEKVLKNLAFVTFLEGRAKFVSVDQIEVGNQTFSADKFIIATGSTAKVPLIEGIEEVGFVTHIEALKLKEQPKELLVLGAGPTALEFAQMYARFGTRVTILQHSDRIFRPGEKELTERLAEILTKEGVKILRNVEFKSARKDGNQKVLNCFIDGKEQAVMGDEILLALGKTANTKELDLEKAKVDIDKRQSITVKPNFQTSQNHIFAVGDVTNLPLRLETTAGREGTLAAENALRNADKKIDYNTVPYTIFTDPQLAGVGLTEDQLMEQMGVCACRTVSFKDVPKAIIMRRTEGLIKMVINPKTNQIVGVHILSPYAGELIAEAMMLVKNQNTVDEVINSLPMFPTLSEAIKLAAISFTKDISKLSCCI